MLNTCINKLSKNYLFADIEERVRAFREKNPDAKLISLGIGDCTKPLPKVVTDAMASYANNLSTKFSGYGTGWPILREKIAERFYTNISPDEIFISDGAKPDLGRLQFLFDSAAKVAIQDPAYPVYIDVSVLSGRSVQLMPCTPENNFFPETFPDADIFYICSPNNPTGAVATKEQLTRLVQHAQQTNAVIIFDAAYAPFTKLPHTIFDIPGARDIAIETGSFSKLAGFSGVRLGWTVVPKGPLHDAWKRLDATLFNGPSNIAQAGGLACLEEGWDALQKNISHYLENARILKEALPVPTYGTDAPYIWADFGKDSWEVFQDLLENTHLITTPGSGYGPSGNGFIRLSAFGERSLVLEAQERLINHL